jgi:hypothetical protein
LTFEKGSKLARVGADQFYRCPSLKSIVIPRSIREMSKD